MAPSFVIQLYQTQPYPTFAKTIINSLCTPHPNSATAMEENRKGDGWHGRRGLLW